MMRIEEHYSLKPYNTFGIDVRCRYFVEADRVEDWLDFIAAYEWKPEELLVLGRGSNFLFTEDFEGTVFYPAMQGIEVIGEHGKEVRVRVGAGVEWDDFVAWAVAQNLGGVENLSWIPGHVGASPVQNVGAYGMEAGDTICEVEAIDLEKAGLVRIPAEACEFAYRDSIFKRQWKNKFLITHVVFGLSREPEYKLDYGSIREELEKTGETVDLQHIRQAIIRIRQAKLPDVATCPNAGSFFKNPLVDRVSAERLLQQYPRMPVYPVDEERVKLAAGWMIEQCGWKGRELGKAGVYEHQALVLVNKGGADGKEIARLANEVKKSVFMKFGIWIEPEVYVR